MTLDQDSQRQTGNERNKCIWKQNKYALKSEEPKATIPLWE